MGVSEQSASGRRELIVARLFEAEIKPLAAIFGASFALNFADLVIAADRATYHAVRPAHLFDVLKALIVSRKPYEDFGEADRLGMDSL
jgi:hypothetical protein